MQQTSATAHPRQPPIIQADAGFTEHVNSAFKNYHSILALSRSTLANSALVAPALVRDSVSPTADERGHALRLALQWAVNLLAPEPPEYPLGTPRPYDDPTWRDPRWWRYNILRHRYLEPLHPDEFVEGGRYTETLIGLTGIPSADTFFEERNRAIREVAAWLRQQLTSGTSGVLLSQGAAAANGPGGTCAGRRGDAGLPDRPAPPAHRRAGGRPLALAGATDASLRASAG
jgi:hypothetical protein